MLTISRLSRWSINYYNDTARQAAQARLDRQRANGGLGEYYSEGDTRAPTWLIAGDAARTVELVGLDGRAADGGTADPDVVQRWLDDGIAPNGQAGRAFTKGSVHGFDLTFAAPKSVSLLRALTDDRAEKAMRAAHQRAITAAMTYLHQHAGYTRVHNPVTGMKDLQRLSGLVGIAYQHETSRCGDPHLHTHVIVPNRQARADGALVSIDSKSLFHEAKAAGIVYQAVLRHELHGELGLEWAPVDPLTGMAEIAAVPKDSIQAWPQRSSRLRDWADHNLVIVDGEPTPQQLAAAQKATRPAKPESKSWAQLQQDWRADARGLTLDRAAHLAARAALRAAPRLLTDRAQLARMVADIDKAACTRADLVEWVGALLPVDVPGDARALIEQIVDTVEIRDAYWAIFDTDELTAAATTPGPELVAAVQRRIDAFADTYNRAFPSAVKCLLSDREQLTSYLRFPLEHHRRIRHSNFIERTFGETRRRVKVIGRLPGEASCLNLVWAVLDRASRGWRGMAMPPTGTRLLADLRHQLFDPPTQLRQPTTSPNAATPESVGAVA